MKRLAILFALLVAFVANTFAQADAVPAPLQTEKASRQDRKAKMKKAANQLGLSAEQKAKMKDIGLSLKGKMMAIKTDESLSKDQKKIQIGEIAKQHQADVKALLTPEQFTKWEEMKKGRREKMKEMRGNKKGNNDGDN